MPVSRGLQNLETGGRGAEEERETLVVGVRAQANLLFRRSGYEGLRVFGRRVVKESGYAAGMRDHGVEVGFWEVEGERKESKEVAREIEDLR